MNKRYCRACGATGSSIHGLKCALCGADVPLKPEDPCDQFQKNNVETPHSTHEDTVVETAADRIHKRIAGSIISGGF